MISTNGKYVHIYFTARWLAAAFILATVCFAIRYITLPEILNWDEGYYLNAARGYLEYHTLFVRMWRVPESSSLIVGGGPGYLALLSFEWLKFAGVTLISARVFSFFFLILSLILVMRYVKRLYSLEASLLSGILFVGSFSFASSISARLDSFAFVAYLSILLLFERALRANAAWDLFLAGFLVLFGAEAHIFAWVYGSACGTYLLYLSVSKQISWRGCGAYALGGISGAILYLIFHLIYGGEELRLILSGCSHCEVRTILDRLHDVTSFLLSKPTESLLFIAAIVFSARGLRTKYRDSLIRSVWIASVSILSFIFFVPRNYEAHLIPALIPLVAGSLWITLQNGFPKKFASMVVVFLIMLLGAKSIQSEYLLNSGRYEPILPMGPARCIKEVISKDDVVLMPPPFFAAMPDQGGYLGLAKTTFDLAELRGESPIGFLERESPKAVLILGLGDESEGYALSYLKQTALPYQQLSANVFVRSDLPVDVVRKCLRSALNKESSESD